MTTPQQEMNALKALSQFDAILRTAEQKGVKVVTVESLRKRFDMCVDKFEVFAADLNTWNMDVLNG
jgi:hypothetical protein